MTTRLDSPALKSQSTGYPHSWHGKVPSRIRMNWTVGSDNVPFQHKRLCAVSGKEYDAYVNSHGALCAIFDDGDMLGLKPNEFSIVGWHEQVVIFDIRQGGDDVTLLKEIPKQDGRKRYIAVNLRDQE